MTPDPHPWATTLAGLHDEVWTRLARGVHDRRAPARHPVLATVAQDGAPQARMVVLRAADRAEGVLQAYTDLHSAKVAELRARPLAALHVWEGAAHLQIRLAAGVQILTGPEVAHLWDRLAEVSRLSYGTTPSPGTPLPGALDYAKAPDPDAFAVLALRLHEIEVLHLGPQHRRARFLRADGWAGGWLAP